MAKYLPVEVTIKRPFPTTRKRGIYATGKYGNNLKLRVSEIDERTIKKAADRCGVSVSHFARWCATHVAKALLDAENASEVNNEHDREQGPD